MESVVSNEKESGTVHKGRPLWGGGRGFGKKDKIAQFERMSFVDGPTEPDIVVILPKGRVTCKYANILGRESKKRLWGH